MLLTPGSFVPTMPISLMILALVYIQVGPNLFGQDLVYKTAYSLFWIGAAGIYLFRWIIIPLLFQNEKVSCYHATFGWYIPPVSHLLIPVPGFDLLHITHNGDHISIIMAISLISLGIGLTPTAIPAIIVVKVIMDSILVTMTLTLLVIWLIVTALTLKGLKNLTIFED